MLSLITSIVANMIFFLLSVVVSVSINIVATLLAAKTKALTTRRMCHLINHQASQNKMQDTEILLAR